MDQYKDLKSGEHKEDTEIRVAGRIYNKRASGTKLVFYDIKSNGIRLQIMCQAQAHSNEDFEKQHEHLRRGDIIGVIGYPGRTAPKTKIERGSLALSEMWYYVMVLIMYRRGGRTFCLCKTSHPPDPLFTSNSR